MLSNLTLLTSLPLEIEKKQNNNRKNTVQIYGTDPSNEAERVLISAEFNSFQFER
jgi:hypothetical protein